MKKLAIFNKAFVIFEQRVAISTCAITSNHFFSITDSVIECLNHNSCTLIAKAALTSEIYLIKILEI